MGKNRGATFNSIFSHFPRPLAQLRKFLIRFGPCLRVAGGSMSVVDDKQSKDGAAEFSLAKLIGPGLMVAAAGIGAGDMVSATMGGAGYGLALLWAVALAAFLKCFLNEGIARWQLATNTTAIEGWCTYLPWWVQAYFVVYLVIWTGFVT